MGLQVASPNWLICGTMVVVDTASTAAVIIIVVVVVKLLLVVLGCWLVKLPWRRRAGEVRRTLWSLQS